MDNNKINFGKYYRKILRYFINKKNRTNLNNRNFTLLTSNCTGGIIYSNLGIKFNSPTINLYMEPRDFIKFCKNINMYIDMELEEVKDHDRNYPVARLGDLLLYMVHYNTFEEAKTKWNKRKKRINFNNIFIMCFERDGCTYDDIIEFEKIPFDNKIIFVTREMPEIKSSVYNPIFSSNNSIIDLTKYYSKFTGKQPLDLFDYVKWLNHGNDNI